MFACITLSINLLLSAQTSQEQNQPQAVSEALPAEQEQKQEVLESAEQAPAEQMPAQETPPQEQAVAPEQEVAPAVQLQEQAKAEPEKPVPAPVQEQPIAVTAPEQPEEEIEIKALDTEKMAEPKGNWLYKKIWWEKAERLYEKTRQLFDKIFELRMGFFARRHELDHMILDPFYLKNGFEEGELTEIIATLTAQIGQEQTKDQDEQSRNLQRLLAEEKKNLEQLQLSSQNIMKVSHAVDDALIKLLEQLNQARHYEQQSWDHFKAINRELSDKRARELYYAMDTFWKNLNNINNYLADAYTKYFDQLITKAQTEVERSKELMQGLKEKGIDLQVQALKLRKPCKAVPSEEEEAEEEQPRGILGTLWHWVTFPVRAIGNGVAGIFNLFSGWFGGSQEVEDSAPDRSDEVSENIDYESDIDQEIE